LKDIGTSGANRLVACPSDRHLPSPAIPSRAQNGPRTKSPDFPRLLLLGSADFCRQLPSSAGSKNAKSPDFTGLSMVDAQGIEPWTSPV